ncbi:MAG: alpha/beta hydrolase [Plectolyngbya sp. WJT66-NPBG17]|jgi:pimeloyl-ACP methyl ester carboxylesterase|nr:alpha/beta hydrolase [Plectolyngbya sp. WJT66-NPBG17]MBW4528897.1 alpha/beta hydrolase [Phormidium tanganyikae FI6-MK23]
MSKEIKHNCRSFLGTAAVGIVTAEMALMGNAHASFDKPKASELRLAPIKQINAAPLDIGYYEAGPSNGFPVLLLHRFPYSIDSYVDVAPMLAMRECRVIVPYLRGHGSTRFLNSKTPRSGQQSEIGADVIALMDALKLNRAVLAGYDWGGRAACVVAALYPERCTGLVSVNGYLIQDIAKAKLPIPPSIESGLWYQYYFQTERGRAGLIANRREIAKALWIRNSPNWHFDEATLDRHASAFDNLDYVDIVIHSYRHRLGLAAGYPPYEEIENRLAAQPIITVPTITLDGDADGIVPATDGKSAAAKFIGYRQHRVVPSVGHNLPQEAPIAFAAAVWELASKKH